MDNSEENHQVTKHRNSETYFPTPDPTTLYQFSNKFDWILLTEGKSDIDFYKQFTVTFKDIKNNYKSKNDLNKDINNTLKDISSKKKSSCRKKIIRLIEEKTRNSETKHFYGIIDRDYRKEFIDSSIEDNIIITDAHSLETMLVKYASKRNDVSYFFNVLHPITNTITEDEAINIFEEAKCISSKIGHLRKFKPEGFSYGKITEYSKYISFDNETSSFDFDLSSYLKDLIEQSKYEGETEELLQVIEEGTLKSKTDKARKWYNICRGHDLVDLINSIIFVLGCKNADLTTQMMIDIFNKEEFYYSPIYNWLKKIENEKNKEKKSLTDPKYRDYIISVG